MNSGHLCAARRISAGCGWLSVSKPDKSWRVLLGVGGLLRVATFGELFPPGSNKTSASLTSGTLTKRSSLMSEQARKVPSCSRRSTKQSAKIQVLQLISNGLITPPGSGQARWRRKPNMPLCPRQRLARFVRKTLSPSLMRCTSFVYTFSYTATT